MKLHLTDIRLPLAVPFGTAHGTLHSKHNLLVTLEDADGLCGYGEVPPSLAYQAITADTERAALEVGVEPELHVRRGQALQIWLAPDALHLFDAKTELSLLHTPVTTAAGMAA